MSIVLDPTSHAQHTIDKVSSSRADLAFTERQPNKNSTKNKTLRLDSPTTIEACQELGIIVDDLRPKVIEDFKESGVEEEIIQLRFNHYFKRYTQNITDLMARKRQLQRQRQRQLKAQQQQQKQLELHHIDTNQSLSKRPFITNVSFNTPQGNKTSFASHSMLPPPMFSSYSKTMSYLRGSHETPDTKTMYDIVGTENSHFMDETVEHFDQALGNEISKFNKLKRQKQREAKDTFEKEMRRVKTVEDMKAKEKRRDEHEKKVETEKKKMREEKRRKAEDKLEKIRDTEKRFMDAKIEEREKMQKKLEDNKKKLAEENEQRAKHLAEYEEKLELKKKIAEERRERIKQEEQERCDMLKFEIETKLYGSVDRHMMNMNEKTSRVKMQITKIEENVKKMKEKQEHDQEEFVQTLVEKLVKKEENLKTFQHQQMLDLKKKEKDMDNKNKRFFGHQSNLKEQYEERVNEINERFRRVQENLKLKKEQDEKTMRIRQEATKLKIIDKQENYLKKQRQVAHERQKILDRQKYNQEKLQWLKNQRDILQQTKVEVSIQAKIERDRIEQAIQALTKLTSEAGATTDVNEAQKKLLKDILKPEDYEQIIEEERRKEEERQEAEEARKNGNNLPPVVKAR